eukprot:scaffold39999_cov63-Phaeocystis_antarctica.AAC.6
MPSRPRPTPRSASYALLSTRQQASAFNQPLSFDTSSVREFRGMSNMFWVRSAHALAPPAFTAGPSPCAWRACAAAGPRPPAPGPHLALHHTPSLRLGSTQTPCPTPTSGSSVARGRAPRPSPLLATARAGYGSIREAAPEDRLHVSS